MTPASASVESAVVRPGADEKSVFPGRPEVFALICLVGLFLIFNLATWNLYPAVWCDEVSFSEPAINFVNGGAFTTTVWEFQPPNTFPTLNCPLYSLSLVPWLSIFGTSLAAVRSWNYFLMAIAGCLLWCVSWRFRLVTSARLRLWLVAFVHLGYGMSFSYRCSRPDILGTISLLLLWLALGGKHSIRRDLLVAAFAAMTIWIGLQVSLFACFTCGAALFLARWIKWRDIVLIGAGMSIGVISMLWLFQAKGVLSYFLPTVFSFLGKNYAHAPHASILKAISEIFRLTLPNYISEFSTDALLLGVALWATLGWKRLNGGARKWILFCVMLVFAVPPLFHVVGHYAFYYSYMRFIPATLALFGVWSEIQKTRLPDQKILLDHALPTFSFLAALVGLPMRLALTLACTTLAPRSDYKQNISSNAVSDDVVFADITAFFDVKPRVRTVYDFLSSGELWGVPQQAGRSFTPEEKASVSLLIVRVEQSAFYTNFFGGNWKAVSPPFGDRQDFGFLSRLPVVGPRVAHYAQQPQTAHYQLQIFRRVDAKETSGNSAKD